MCLPKLNFDLCEIVDHDERGTTTTVILEENSSSFHSGLQNSEHRGNCNIYLAQKKWKAREFCRKPVINWEKVENTYTVVAPMLRLKNVCWWYS